MRSGKVVEAGTGRARSSTDPKTDYTKALMAAAFDIATAPAGVVSRVGRAMPETHERPHAAGRDRLRSGRLARASGAPSARSCWSRTAPADPTIRYAVVWKQPHGVLARLPNLKAIFSIGAGVDHILTDPELPDVPIVRVVADNLTQRMTEYVVWRVLDHHRRGSRYRAQQAQQVWHEPAPAAGAARSRSASWGSAISAAPRRPRCGARLPRQRLEPPRKVGRRRDDLPRARTG